MKSLSRRQFVATGAVAGAALALGPALKTAQAAPAVKLLVSSSMQKDAQTSAHYAWFERFASNVQASLGDKVELTYFPNGQLGKEADVIQQVKSGGVDMAVTGSSNLATICPEFGMLDYGYVFDSYQHAAKALDSGVSEQLGKIIRDKTGVSVVGWGFHFGARSVYTKNKLATMAELKGVKLRVLPAPAFLQTFSLLDAIPTPVPVNELYTALQTGVVDGFEHDPGTAIDGKFYEVAKNCLLTEHLFSPMCAIIGKRALAKIPADLQPAFLQAARDATVGQRDYAVGKAKETLDKLAQLGVAITPVSPAERKAAQKVIAEQLWAKFGEQYPATKPAFAVIDQTRSI